MRITKEEKEIIISTIRKYFGNDSNIYLFGSRINDTKKGGDIDLYVESNLPIKELIKAKVKVLVELEDKLGERKIDIVIKNKEIEEELIHRIAKKEGIKL